MKAVSLDLPFGGRIEKEKRQRGTGSTVCTENSPTQRLLPHSVALPLYLVWGIETGKRIALVLFCRKGNPQHIIKKENWQLFSTLSRAAVKHVDAAC